MLVFGSNESFQSAFEINVHTFKTWFEQFSLFLTDRGTYYACGKNTDGQLGDSTTSLRKTPVHINNVNFTSISSFGNHVLGTNNTVTLAALGL